MKEVLASFGYLIVEVEAGAMMGVNACTHYIVYKVWDLPLA